MGKAVGFGELTELPLKGWYLHCASDRVLKKTNHRLLNYIIVVVVAVVVVVVDILRRGTEAQKWRFQGSDLWS